MHALSRSEEHHRRMLVRRFRSLLGREYSLSEDQHGTADMGAEDPSSLGEQVFAGQASALDVVSFAIGMEGRAARYYSERLQEVDDRRDVRMLRRLVHFETRHKDRLQAEYSRLNSRASKITYSHHTNWWG
jgi:rubrerythrin